MNTQNEMNDDIMNGRNRTTETKNRQANEANKTNKNQDNVHNNKGKKDTPICLNDKAIHHQGKTEYRRTSCAKFTK